MKTTILILLAVAGFALAACESDHASGSAGGHVSGGGAASGSVSGSR